MNYRVEWAIDIFDVATPEDAAREASGHQRTADTTATVFDVYEENGEGSRIRVDLLKLSEKCA